MFSKGLEKLYLLFDSAKCHLTPGVREHLKANKIDLLVIPPLLTNLLQPADVVYFSILKKEYYSKWNESFLYAPKSKTNQGNIYSPGYVQVIDWLSKILAKFEKSSIVESFIIVE